MTGVETRAIDFSDFPMDTQFWPLGQKVVVSVPAGLPGYGLYMLFAVADKYLDKDAVPTWEEVMDSATLPGAQACVLRFLSTEAVDKTIKDLEYIKEMISGGQQGD